jgi:4-cresol dehydrogenase (hydroxylating)
MNLRATLPLSDPARTERASDADRSALELALDAWRDVIGPEHVIVAAGALLAAQTATFSTTHRVPAILRPANREELQRCLMVANAHRIALNPVSGGRNYGYGSRVPAQDGCVLLHLGRMNRILDYDEKLAHVTVEPGVTFTQLFEFLERAGSNLMLNTTGGPADGSVIGNIIERGLGAGQYGDRAQHSCGYEVVLPTGRLIHTGYGRFDTPLTPLCSWGVGPHLNGLFLQSNYGIVTRMTIWLAPRPDYLHTFYFSVSDEERLPGLFDALQTLKLHGASTTTYALWNDYKLLSTLQRYPWEITGNRTPLPDDARMRLREQWDVAPWNGFGAIYSPSARHGRAERALIGRLLRPHVDEIAFVSDTKARIARALQRPIQFLTGYDMEGATRSHQRGVSPWLGAPRGNVESAYWRKRMPLPATLDPDADACGAIWCSPCLPFAGAHVEAAMEIIERITLHHGFEPNVAWLPTSARVLHAIIAILFDREIDGEDARALNCHDALLEALQERGYLPYRLGILSMHGLPPVSEDELALRLSLKRALDPNFILAPGRYPY